MEASERDEREEHSAGIEQLETGLISEQVEKEAESEFEGKQTEIGQIFEQERYEALFEAEAEADLAEDQPVVAIVKKRELPEGFVYVDEVLEHALYDIRYYSEYNFVGERIDGYHAPFAILSEQAAIALKNAEQVLEPLGYVLLIYDAYRPQKAVEHFGRWAADEQDVKMKEEFYPDIDKEYVFKLGYLSRRSGHSRGSTVDLTLADQETGEPLDMGGIHDFLGEISAHDAAGLTEVQAENRLLLKETMMAVGFKPYRKEWWHYTLNNEPYPKKYFDFDVE
ncbi:peptidase M15 [Paenibacillus lentus]|uniref:D-alanyl-D-alanine dipeptidase n=2 Tax=Paenibacillus lentus TaxID=1338368 RepID=A0A3S8S193_9BACL|nr:peptidase M15 [Paenibacillus lentus]